MILSPDPELSTPTESRHTTCFLGGKSPSVKLMSRRENKRIGQNQPKDMDKTMQKLQHIGSIKDHCVHFQISRYAANYRYLIAHKINAQGWKKILGRERGLGGGCILKIVIVKERGGGYNFHMYFFFMEG